MNTQTELYGKYQIVYRPTNKGISVGSIEKIDKFTDLHESDENRFDLKVQIENTLNDVIDFVYREKLYMSREQAEDLVIELLN